MRLIIFFVLAGAIVALVSFFSRTPRPDRSRQNRLRELAWRQGLQLVKIRSKDPSAFNYGRYRLIDAEFNDVIVGHPLTFAIDDVEDQLAMLETLDWTGARASKR